MNSPTEVYQDVPGLIVECKSGLLWTNQTGGVCCHHPVAEGVFLRLEGEFFLCACSGGVNPQDVQKEINKQGWPLMVDVGRWDEAEEAWWPVLVICDGEIKKAILVTDNCD